MPKKWGKKLITNDGRITPNGHAHLQTMTQTRAKFQTVLFKTVREVLPQATHIIMSQVKTKLSLNKRKKNEKKIMAGLLKNHMHIFRPCRTSKRSF